MTAPTQQRSKFRAIAAGLIRQIETGALAPGDYIPSVRSLAQTHGMSTATATRVHEEVHRSGLVRSISGLGVMVKHPSENPTG